MVAPLSCDGDLVTALDTREAEPINGAHASIRTFFRHSTKGHRHHSGASRVPNIKKHIFKNPVYAVPEWVVVYQSTSIGTLFTPFPVSGVHDILSSQNWSKINKPVIKSVQWPEERYYHAASHITGTVFVMIGGLSVSITSDVWLCDTNQWNEVLSPFTHEFSSNHIVNMLTHCVLILTHFSKAQNECPNISYELTFVMFVGI